jgi:putative nucleotidyltransferase with HDIG domain
MNKDDFDFVNLHDLRIGLFVDLDVGWMAHPFPSSRFKISSERQIEILKGLGVGRIRYVPSKSDAPGGQGDPAQSMSEQERIRQALAQESAQQALKLQQARLALRVRQQNDLTVCERRFSESAQQYHRIVGMLQVKPVEAAQQCQTFVHALSSDIQQQGDIAIRLLTEAAGDKAALHPVNVTIISLLLGRAMGLQDAELGDLGMAAFLHDMGKVTLPERVRRFEENFSSAEIKVYQDHVSQGVRMAKEMQLSTDVIHAIAQHHELADGSGFPERIKLDAQSVNARILAVVNRYDGLCNPSKPGAAMTPHEALAMIFAQQKTRFDGATLSAFIRMMGVYPPGSVVQLNDERHAIVVAVNSARPLKPRVIVHEPSIPRHEAVILDLEHAPNASIRRSLKPSTLPSAALDYLQPRPRVYYFFESAQNSSGFTPIQ